MHMSVTHIGMLVCNEAYASSRKHLKCAQHILYECVKGDLCRIGDVDMKMSVAHVCMRTCKQHYASSREVFEMHAARVCLRVCKGT